MIYMYMSHWPYLRQTIKMTPYYYSCFIPPCHLWLLEQKHFKGNANCLPTALLLMLSVASWDKINRPYYCVNLIYSYIYMCIWTHKTLSIQYKQIKACWFIWPLTVKHLLKNIHSFLKLILLNWMKPSSFH